MILDYILIVSFLGSIARGFSKGFSQVFIGAVAFIIALIISISLNNWIGDIVLKSDFGKQTQETIATDIRETFNKQEELLFKKIPLLSFIHNTKDTDATTSNIDIVSDSIASKTLKTLTSVILVILSMLLFKFIIKIIKAIAKVTKEIPVIGTVDRILGGIFGIFSGIIVFSIIFLLVVLMQSFPQLTLIKEQYNASQIVLLVNSFIF